MADVEKKLSKSLRERTLQMLVHRPRTVTFYNITRDTGLPLIWLESFKKSKSTRNDVNRVQTLYEYLSGQQLFE